MAASSSIHFSRLPPKRVPLALRSSGRTHLRVRKVMSAASIRPRLADAARHGPSVTASRAGRTLGHGRLGGAVGVDAFGIAVRVLHARVGPKVRDRLET